MGREVCPTRYFEKKMSLSLFGFFGLVPCAVSCPLSGWALSPFFEKILPWWSPKFQPLRSWGSTVGDLWGSEFRVPDDGLTDSMGFWFRDFWLPQLPLETSLYIALGSIF